MSSFSLLNFLEVYQCYWFLKERGLVFIDIFLLFFCFQFHWFLTHILFIYFHVLMLGLFLLLFFQFLKVEACIIDLKLLFLSNISIWCYKFSSMHWFTCISQNLLSCIFVYVQFKIISNFPWYLFDPRFIWKCALLFLNVFRFSCYPSVFDF